MSGRDANQLACAGVMEVSIQTRCPNFGDEHQEPCPACYSICVTSVRVPYRPPVRRLEITTRTREDDRD